ncbi:DUF1572 family protein [uncultured Algibacter sp.]|uniref:DUF1572 family protein n=1 Tax=uncultured Algibacter sp. TaxID=298659 RepID=UPI00260DA3B5|nr:DUF1572 family protein [uncultured Algibacter sp.]
MILTEHLTGRLKEILTEGKWVTGTNIKDQISNLDWRIATKKIYSLNTISDLVFHLDYYISGVLNVLEGGKLVIKDKYSFDAPPINSELDWIDLVHKFCNNSEKFIVMISNMSEADLHKTFEKEQYGSYLRNIEAIIEHSYYHFGQIILIKKMINS